MAEIRDWKEIEFKNWAKRELLLDFDSDKMRKHFKSNQSTVFRDAEEHPFFEGFGKKLTLWEEEYKEGRDITLFILNRDRAGNAIVPLYRKEYSSVVNKAYRHNYVNNNNFKGRKSDFPTYKWCKVKDWLTPENWFQILNDTVRTMVVCQYIDGPVFLFERIKAWADECSIGCREAVRAEDSGYYAYHLYPKVPTSVWENGILEDREVEVEIQLTTRLQASFYQVAHARYEYSRNKSRPTSEKEIEEQKKKERWTFKSPDFRVSYMGHTLHLLEAVMLDIRDTYFKKS